MKRIILFGTIITLFCSGCDSNDLDALKINKQLSIIQKSERELNGEIIIIDERTEITYDEGHQKLQKVINKLNEHAENLKAGDYKGYVYATGQLYNYLLAIHYKGKDLLDESYPYEYNYSAFSKLTNTYNKFVDFSSVELVEMKHEGFDVDITLSYQNKVTQETDYLIYHISYGQHGLTDRSTFNQ